jgi:hypothetical protein
VPASAYTVLPCTSLNVLIRPIAILALAKAALLPHHLLCILSNNCSQHYNRVQWQPAHWRHSSSAITAVPLCIPVGRPPLQQWQVMAAPTRWLVALRPRAPVRVWLLVLLLPGGWVTAYFFS